MVLLIRLQFKIWEINKKIKNRKKKKRFNKKKFFFFCFTIYNIEISKFFLLYCMVLLKKNFFFL